MLLFPTILADTHYIYRRMILSVAGPYGRNYSQGAVGGALAELGFKAGEVYKL